MHISISDLFSIGIGPSSSHTVGPMKAACAFVEQLAELPCYEQVAKVRCDLYGSLAATGKGHGTATAIIFGLMGEMPATIEVATMESRLAQIESNEKLILPGGKSVRFIEKECIDFHRLKPLPLHPNGMHCMAFDPGGSMLHEEVYYSLGGGFIATAAEMESPDSVIELQKVPYPFDTGDELLKHCEGLQCSIAELMLANENAIRPEKETRKKLHHIWDTMQECIQNGIANTGTLPGGLKVKRRAHRFHQQLLQRDEGLIDDPLSILDWVGLYALAVNEENAGGGRVVTAPTNGAAGIIPAVLTYATKFASTPNKDGVHRCLLTAAAIASLYKKMHLFQAQMWVARGKSESLAAWPLETSSNTSEARPLRWKMLPKSAWSITLDSPVTLSADLCRSRVSSGMLWQE